MGVVYVGLGIACLIAVIVVVRLVRRRVESNEPGWMQSELGSQFVSVGLVVLGVTGLSLLVKAFAG